MIVSGFSVQCDFVSYLHPSFVLLILSTGSDCTSLLLQILQTNPGNTLLFLESGLLHACLLTHTLYSTVSDSKLCCVQNNMAKAMYLLRGF